MKIIYTGGFRFNDNEAAEGRVLNNDKLLRDLGHEVIFVCWGGRYLENEKKSEDFYKEGFKYYISNDFTDGADIGFVQRLINFALYGRKTFKFIKTFQPDIVIGYNPTAYFTSRMLSIEKEGKIRFISDITEWFDANEFPGGKMLPFSWINNFNMTFLQKKVKSKIVISEYLDRYYNESNNLLLPPLIDVNDNKWKNRENNTINKIKNSKLIFIFAGYHGIKDLLYNILIAVIKAYDDGVDLKIKILGAKNSEIENLIGKNNLDKYQSIILTLGKVKNVEIPLHYINSDFTFIIRKPIRKNMAGFPTKFAEAMISGCPVIANDTSDLRKFLKDSENGCFVDDFTIESITKTIKKIESFSENQMRLMKMNARKTGLDYFHYENYLKITDNFLHKV